MRLVLPIGIAVVLIPFAVHAQTTVAGATPGSFRVTESGAAEYRIPIRVPPGIGGMEPRLALVYNSQAGNGLLGVGWNLEGLSAITRCPRTMAQDGVRGGVNYDMNDRYCLDGQRLVAISGAYGADGTEYRTERESFTKVISYGAAGNGPAWFKAWTKSGQILEYGNTADSRIEAQGKLTVRLWAVNKVADTKGNSYHVAYLEDNPNGYHQPSVITFTENDAEVAPSVSIEFLYEVRGDVWPSFEAGSILKTPERLSQVRTKAGTSVVTSYRLKYETSGPNDPSRLIGIQECDASDSCLPATSFAWEPSPSGFARITTDWRQPESGWGNFQMHIVDLNGDGKSDVLWNALIPSGPNVVYAAVSNGDGTFTRVTTDWRHPENGWGSFQLHIADVNGDGKSDLVWNALIAGGPNVTYVAVSNGDGTFTRITDNWRQPENGWGPYRLHIADINGDGRSDLVWNALIDGGPNVVYAAVSNGDGTFTRVTTDWRHPESGWGGFQLHIADINGDGKSDLVWNALIASGPNVTYAAVSNGDGTFTRVIDNWRQPENGWGSFKLHIADINGDGKSDLVWNALVAGGPNVVYAALSNGDGTFTRVTTDWRHPENGWGSFQLHIADINGDGKSDLVWNALVAGGPNVTYAAVSNGDGTFARVIDGWTQPENGWGSYRLYIADVNGDGKSDLVWNVLIGGGPNATYVNASAFNDANKLTGATAGLGGSVAFAYKSIADPTIYAKDSGAVYPLMDAQVALHVVSSMMQGDGVGGTLERIFRYGGLKVDLSGRGMLGLRWMEATDQATGVKLRTENRQDWPYVGLPWLVRKMQSSGAMLSEAVSTYACKNPATGAACTLASGNRYFPHAVQSIETGSDLNGAVLPTVTTSTQYDGFGNAILVTVSTGDGYSKATSNDYTNDVPNWLLGRLKSSTVQSTMP